MSTQNPEFGPSFGKFYRFEFVTLVPMKTRRFAPLVALMFAACGAPVFAASPAIRPATWAVAVSAKGVENLYRVEADLYRSARPQSEGFRELGALGVKSVLDVESPGDEEAARGASLKVFHVPMTAWGLRDDRVLEALRILTDPKNRPIVVHCHLGADRTGAMVALYRVVVQGWSKEDAIREMDDGGYHHSSLWSNLDRYVSQANVAALRKQLGIVTPAPILAAALASSPSAGVTTVAGGPAPSVGIATSSPASAGATDLASADPSKTGNSPVALAAPANNNQRP